MIPRPSRSWAGFPAVRALRAYRALACLGLLALFTGCSEDPVPATEEETDQRVPQQVMSQMQLRQTSTRGLLWILEAEQASLYADNEPMDLKGLTIRFFDGKPNVQSVLTSKRGQVLQREKMLTAQDSVVVRSEKGDQLETEFLRWDPETERVTTPEPFRLRSGGDILTGVGIDADPDLREYVIHSRLKAVVRDVEDVDGGEGGSEGTEPEAHGDEDRD